MLRSRTFRKISKLTDSVNNRKLRFLEMKSTLNDTRNSLLKVLKSRYPALMQLKTKPDTRLVLLDVTSARALRLPSLLESKAFLLKPKFFSEVASPFIKNKYQFLTQIVVPFKQDSAKDAVQHSTCIEKPLGNDEIKEKKLGGFDTIVPRIKSILNEGYIKKKHLFASVIVAQCQKDSSLTAIPPPPEVIDIVQTKAEGIASLGLGGWSPVGLIQNALEYLHIGLDLPWWGAIVIGTIIVRLSMFPLVIIAQRNAAKMNNYLPQLQVLQLKMSEARQTGNQLEAAKYGQEIMLFMKEKNLNPLKNLVVPLAQMPVFISFFIGLRQMANAPVDSFRDGGIFWFSDLTVPDQYFLLPVITSLTLWLTIEVGTDSARLTAQNLQTMKYVLRALPLVILPFTVNFPGAILCYWCSSNMISLAQVGFLKIPKVRNYFNIEPLINHTPDALPVKPKGFVKGMKDSWSNMKITNEIEGRRRFDELQFQKAGRGPVVKTYKFDPTKQDKPVQGPAVQLKKRD